MSREGGRAPRMRRLASFSLVGAAATLGYALLALAGTALFNAPAALVSGFAYALASILSYCGHRGLTFRSNRAHGVAIPRFMQVTLLGHLVSIALPALLSDGLGLPSILPVALTCVAVPLLNFIILPRYVFGAEPGR